MLPYAFDYFWFKLTTDKLWIETTKWIATAFVCVSAAVITIWPLTALDPHVFVGFLIGHVIWSFFTAIMKEWSLLALNLFFVGLDAFGVIIRL